MSPDAALRLGLERQIRELDDEIERATSRLAYLQRTRESVSDRLSLVPA